MKTPSHPSLAILISQKALKKRGEQPDDGGPEGALEAMQAFIDAVKDGDAEAALEEYRNLHTLCPCGGDEE